MTDDWRRLHVGAAMARTAINALSCGCGGIGMMAHSTAPVAMGDGVHLATDIHLPDGDGPFPVILERTPYGRPRPAGARSRPRTERQRRARKLAAYFRRMAMRSSIRTRAAATAPRAVSSNICPMARTASTPVRGWSRRLVRRTHLHDGPVLCGAHAGGAGLPRPAGTGGAGAGLWRFRQRVEVRHPPVGCVRAEAGDLGVEERAASRPRRRPIR